MKKLKIITLLGLILIGQSNVTNACDRAWLENPRMTDMQGAKTLMTDFLIMSSNEPWRVYEVPFADPSDMIKIPVKRLDVPSEKYQLITYAPSKFDNIAGQQVCFWLFIPTNIAPEFKNLRDSVMEIIFRLKSVSQKVGDTLSLDPSLSKPWDSQIVNLLHKNFEHLLAGWMMQDFFKRPVQYKDESHDVSFVSLFNQYSRKIIYLGTSFSKPSWFDVKPYGVSQENEMDLSDTLEDEEEDDDECYDNCFHNSDNKNEEWRDIQERLFME